MSDEPIKLQDRLEWAPMTIREKLNFGMGEQEGIKRRECRVRGVLIEAVDELPKIEEELAQARKLIAELAGVANYYALADVYDFGDVVKEVLFNNKDLIEKLTKE